MPDIVGGHFTARQFPVGASPDRRTNDVDRRIRNRDWHVAIRASQLSPNAKLIAASVFDRLGRDGMPEDMAAVTQGELARLCHVSKPTAGRGLDELEEVKFLTVERIFAKRRLANGQISPNGTNQYRLLPGAFEAIAPPELPSPKPYTNPTRLEHDEVRQQLAATRAELAAIREQLATVVTLVRSVPPPVVVAAEASYVAPAAQSLAAPVGATADGADRTKPRPGGPVERTVSEERPLRGTLLTRDPIEGIAPAPTMGSRLIPSLSLQGSPEERETKPHTQRAREPETSTPGVCAKVYDLREREILKHWARRQAEASDAASPGAFADWERTDYATPTRVTKVQEFFASRPHATKQDLLWAIDGSHLEPRSWYTATHLTTVLGEHFERFRAAGRKAAEDAVVVERERAAERGRELEQAREAATVVPLPPEEFEKIRALAGRR